LLGFGGQDVPVGFELPMVVEPLNLFEGDVLDHLEPVPRATPVDHLGRLEAIIRLHHDADAPMSVGSLLALSANPVTN
jgi:hypothetical protein